MCHRWALFRRDPLGMSHAGVALLTRNHLDWVSSFLLDPLTDESFLESAITRCARIAIAHRMRGAGGSQQERPTPMNNLRCWDRRSEPWKSLGLIGLGRWVVA